MVNCQETLLSSSPGKDSGFESAEESVEQLLPLSPEQLSKIRQQVEFYLSDEVVTKDQFLLKHVTKSKEGWLSLKLMSSFRKVKSLCKGYDWHVVADALKHSELLEVNDDCSKVRRKSAIPAEDETRPARTVVAFALADNGSRVPTLESVGSTFGQCGSVVSVRLVPPAEQQADDAVKKVYGRHPKARQLTCAVIEFDKSESAAEAQKLAAAAATAAAADYEVVLLKDCLKPGTKGLEKVVVNRERRTFSDSEVQKRHTISAASSASASASASAAPTTLLSWRDRSQPADTKPRTQSFSQERKGTDKEPRRKLAQELKAVDHAGDAPQSRPRRFTVSEASTAKNLVYAIRQPRGPDGTRGFAATAFA